MHTHRQAPFFFLSVYSCFIFASCVSAEEERRVRANDREYNEKFQYAVSESPGLYSSLRVAKYGLKHFPSLKQFILTFSCIPSDHPEQLHHDIEVQHHHLPARQSVWAVPGSSQHLLPFPAHTAGEETRWRRDCKRLVSMKEGERKISVSVSLCVGTVGV